MENQGYEIHWVPVDGTGVNRVVTADQIITMDPQSDDDENGHQRYLEISSIPSNLDQIAAENLIYMAQDGQMSAICEDGNHHMATICQDFIEEDPQIEAAALENQQNQSCGEQQYFECQVTEEIITDDWVQQQGEERVEIPVDQIGSGDVQFVEELDVPLPTDQDEYTALRPYPCDFCSRRFRKKVSLMNHMIAHQNDRPHICNLCGARYIRRADLLNHLKIHANIPEQQIDEIDEKYLHLNDHIDAKTYRNIGGGGGGAGDHYYDQEWDDNNYEIKPKSKSLKNNRSAGGRQKKIKIKEEEIYENTEIGENIISEQDVQRYPIIDQRKPFVCQQCGIAFAREKAMLSHSRIHGSDSPFECVNCNEMFWDLTTLHDHQKIHHFEASNSEYEPEHEEDENDESESENESKYGEFYCNICGMSFHRQDLLKRHSKTHIKKEVDVKGNSSDYLSLSRHCCNVCGENFAEALDLLAHAEVHARFQPFKCVLCGETFLEEATIKKHLTNVHSNEMTSNSCILCGKQCRDRKALIKHAWDHSREKNHSCSKCGKTFHNKARLKRHMVSHRNKSVTCDVCHEEFPDGRSLMNHRHSHSNSSGKLFPCHECGKTFGSRSSQQIHVRIHTGERPYGCRYCWKAFADGGTLRKHERIHTGEKPYACSVCTRAFNQRVVLREHIRSHHSAIDNKRGTYHCTVCSDEMSSSLELIQHLIRHSDMNTAMQRQPITGPRKYKRRRKLKPHELERLRNEKSDIEFSDLDTSNTDDILGIISSRSSNNKHKSNLSSNVNRSTSSHQQNHRRNRKYSNNTDPLSVGNNSWPSKLISSSTTNDDSYNVVFSNLDNDIQNIEPLVVGTTNNSNNNYTIGTKNSINNNTTSITTSGVGVIKSQKTTGKNSSGGNKRNSNKNDEKSSRPKMIHTQKTRVAVEDGKRKTKTMITRTEQINTERNNSNTNRQNNIGNNNNNDYEITDILVKSIQNYSPIRIKQETSQSDLYDAQLLLEAAATRNEFDKYNPSVVNDLEEILRSPEKSKTPPPKVKDEQQLQYITSTPTSSSISFTEDDVRRSTRARRSIPNRKYLEFETSTTYNNNRSPTVKSTTTHRGKSHKNIDKNILIEDIKMIQNEPITILNQECSSTIKIIHMNNNNIINNNSSGTTASESPIIILPEIKKQKYFECEMCSAIFTDRAQLLDHVPIHI